MSEDEEVRRILRDASKKMYRYGLFIPITFAVTITVTFLLAIFATKNVKEAYAVAYGGGAFGLLVIIAFYLVDWFYCLRFMKWLKTLEVQDAWLKRYLKINKISCVFFMIPITFMFGILGFRIVKVFSRND